MGPCRDNLSFQFFYWEDAYNWSVLILCTETETNASSTPTAEAAAAAAECPEQAGGLGWGQLQVSQHYFLHAIDLFCIVVIFKFYAYLFIKFLMTWMLVWGLPSLATTNVYHLDITIEVPFPLVAH